MISVHHIKEFPVQGADLHLYCGRETSFKPNGDLVNAKLGNPFVVGQGYDRAEAVAAYRDNVPENHLPRIDRLRQINEGHYIALYCFCKPLACHCDVIKELADKTQDQLKHE